MSILIQIGATEYNSDSFTIPEERVFRDSWEANENTAIISVNMERAKDIWRDKIRQARIEPLANLDAAYMKALEIGADTTSIIAQKQVLRDAPALPSIDAATTPNELVKIQPIPNVTIT